MLFLFQNFKILKRKQHYIFALLLVGKLINNSKGNFSNNIDYGKIQKANKREEFYSNKIAAMCY